MNPRTRTPPSRRRTSRADAGAQALYVLDRRSVREIDRLASQEFGVPSILLMENAARHVADVVLERLEGVRTPRALVVSGPGNNGGDGLAAARHLHNAGVNVRIALMTSPERYESDARTNLGIVWRMALPLVVLRSARELRGGADVIVDAMFGTGLARAVAGLAADVIGRINAMRGRGAEVVAVDVPSGLDADTGEALGACVTADVTVTFVGIKRGFLTPAAQAYLGEVVVADIGAPRELVERLGLRVGPGDRPTRGRRRGRSG